MARVSPDRGPQSKPRRDHARSKLLAPIIDAMLLAGGHTMRGIVRALRRKASASCHGKDLQANVRARLYWLKKRGCHAAVKGWPQLKLPAGLQMPALKTAMMLRSYTRDTG